MAKRIFESNIANITVGKIKFDGKRYETDIPQEVKFLKNYPSGSGLMITEIIDKTPDNSNEQGEKGNDSP